MGILLSPYIGGKKDMPKAMTDEEYQTRFKEKWNGKQECLSIYTRGHEIGTFKCLKCNHTRDVAFSEALFAYRCKECANKQVSERMGYSRKEAESVLYQTQGGSFKMVGEYRGSKVPFEAECMNCHSITSMTLDSIRRIGYCQECTMNKSKGEQFLQRLLDFNNIEYVKEKSFDNPINESKQRMDYYIVDINLCIEYQGEGHSNKNSCMYRNDEWQADKNKKEYLESAGVDVLYVDKDDKNVMNQLLAFNNDYFKTFNIPDIFYIKTHHAPMKDVIYDLKRGLSLDDVGKKYQITRKMTQKYIRLTGYETLDNLRFYDKINKLGFKDIKDVAYYARFHNKDEIKELGIGEKPLYKRVFEPLGFSGFEDLRRNSLTQAEVTEYRKGHSTRITAQHFRVNEPWLRQNYKYKTIE